MESFMRNIAKWIIMIYIVNIHTTQKQVFFILHWLIYNRIYIVFFGLLLIK